MSTPYDYWSNASEDDWRSHVAQMVDMDCDLTGDSEWTFRQAAKTLSETYQRLHDEREGADPRSSGERDMDDYFWGLQRSSTVIDSIVGSTCVVLMPWMSLVKRLAISAFTLVETPFPFVPDTESDREKWKRHHASLMQDFGSRVPGKQVSGAEAVWQIGNCFKHSADGGLHKPTKDVAVDLGFSSQLLEIPASAEEEKLREAALAKVSYTLDANLTLGA